MQRIDLVGNQYGLLTVIAYDRTAPRGVAMWRCKCKCGKSRTVASGNLRNGHTSACNSCNRIGNVNPKKYSANDHYFDAIDQPDKSYFLGLMYADGCNYEQTHQVILSLNEPDRCLVESMKDAIEYTGPLSRPRSNGYAGKKGKGVERFQARLSVRSHQMSAALAKHGCGARKTFSLTFPNWIDRELLPHFIRGYLDGDGFCTTWRGNGSSCVGFCSTLAFCDGLQQSLLDNYSIRSKIRPNHSIFTLYINRMDDLKRLHTVLYQNASHFLPRKKAKFDDIASRPIRPASTASEKTKKAWRDSYFRRTSPTRRNSTVISERFALTAS